MLEKGKNRDGIEATKILMAGPGGVEILRRERDLPIFTGGMRDSQSKLDSGMRDEKKKTMKFTGYGYE